MGKSFNGKCISMTNIGLKRLNNDDKAFAFKNEKNQVLLCVFDGMGGHNQGNFASSTAYKVFKENFTNIKPFFSWINGYFWLKKNIKIVNRIIYKKASSDDNYKGSGTTLSIAMVIKNKLLVAQMGDSRTYKVDKNNSLVQLSEDQTVAMHDYRAGLIKKEEVNKDPKRHTLTNALGIYYRPKFDLKIYKYEGEKILVCSDGLYNNLPSSQINNILTGWLTIEQKITELIHQANFNGGSDNIAISLWETL